jgi:PAS domain S-box-containing protein
MMDYKKILENISDAFHYLDKDLIVRYVNKPAELILGKSADDLIGKPLFDSIPEARGSVFEQEYRAALHDKKSRFFESYFDIEPYQNWYEIRIYPGDDGISVYFHVITQQKKEKEKYLFQAQLLEAVNNAVIATDNQHRVTYWNKLAEELYGYTKSEAIGHSIMDLIPLEMNMDEANQILQHIAAGNSWSGDFLCRNKKGDHFPVFITNSPIYNDKGELSGIIGVSSDISERKESEKKLQMSESLIKEKVEEYTAVNEELTQINEELSELMENLTRTNQRLNSLLNAIPDIIFVFNQQGDFIDCHTSNPQDLIIPAEEIIGKNITDVMPEDIAIETIRQISDVVNTGRQLTSHYHLTIKGEILHFETRMVKHGHDHTLAVVHNITDRVKAEESFRSIVESSPYAIYMYKLTEKDQLILISSNPSSEKITGVSYKELIGKTIEEAFPNLVNTEVPSMYKKVARGEIGNQNFQISYNDGKIKGSFEVDVFATGPNTIAVNFIDISERIKTEERNHQLTSIFHLSNDFIGVADANQKALYVNPAGRTMLGIDPELDIQTTRISDYFMEEDLPFIEQTILPTVLREGLWSGEFRFRHFKTGKPIPILYDLFLTLDPKTGEIANLSTISRDISHIKEMESALRNSEERMRSLFENATIGIYRTSIDGKILLANPALVKILGYNSLEELQKRNLQTDGYAPEYPRSEFQERIEREGEIRGLRSAWKLHNGETIYLLESAWLVRDKQNNTMYYEGVVEDITQQKKTIDALNQSEEKYRLIFEKSPLGVLHLDAEGLVTEANDNFFKILGTTSENLAGKSLIESNNQIVKAIKDVLKGQASSYEGLFTSIFNEKSTPVRALFAPIIGEDSVVTGGIGLIEDRTSHQQKEEFEKQVAIAKESARFKQNFLANMSHEIRTPLTGIIGMVEILDNTKLDSQQKEYLNILKNSGENLKEIINQVLDFSKIEAGKVQLHPRIFRFKDLIENTRNLFGGICSYKGLTFESITDDMIPEYIYADNLRVSQILNNLISNAIKFTCQGAISIKANVGESIQASGKIKIKIEVMDKGIGIPLEKQAMLFTPFGQIDEEDTRNYEGSGLGLSICKELTKLMGGKIGVISQPGEGSNFWFTFEAETAISTEVESAEILSEVNPSGKKLSILLAEDKLVNQKVIGLLLTAMGHKVTIACNGLQAVKLYKPNTFDLIFMDIQMPEMDGITATRELRLNHDTLPPIIGLSANAFEGDKEKYMSMGLDDYITKPIKSSDFLELISRLF